MTFRNFKVVKLMQIHKVLLRLKNLFKGLIIFMQFQVVNINFNRLFK